MNSAPIENSDLPALARGRVQVAETPPWIERIDYERTFAAKIAGPMTHLLLEQQLDAESHQIYARTAVRLETMQAVQRQSQWSMDFDPQTQTVALHSIKVQRGGQESDRLAFDRIQFLRREADLERLVMSGHVTLLLVLEDICVGDVVEWSYTVTTKARLLPDAVCAIFSLPTGTVIGRYLFSARYSQSRNVRWKSSSAQLVPVIETQEGRTRCVWRGNNLPLPAVDEGTPFREMPFPWMQISDCADWQTAARAVWEAWEEVASDGQLAKLVEEIRAFSREPLAQINRAIETVQDSVRYLSVNLEMGGGIPASADTVLRRRYGDCKDVAFLLVRVLRELGIKARPILVNAYYRRGVANLLPSLHAFNHVVVEFDFNGETRWIDATIKLQGGGALKKCVPDYGLGLPVDAAATNLVAVPEASLGRGLIDHRETLLLDTAGGSSLLAVVIVATGVCADGYRQEFANEGVEAVAQKRLRRLLSRYRDVARVGQLQYRDDRELNEFAVAETFEVNGFMQTSGNTRTCTFLIQDWTGAAAMPVPGPGERRWPLALPFPCDRVYTVNISSTGMGAIAIAKAETNNEFFVYSRNSKGVPGSFQVTFSLGVLKDVVPKERVAFYRREVQATGRKSSIWLRVPAGYRRGRQRSDFGALPAKSQGQAPMAEKKPVLESSQFVWTAPAAAPYPEYRHRRKIPGRKGAPHLYFATIGAFVGGLFFTLIEPTGVFGVFLLLSAVPLLIASLAGQSFSRPRHWRWRRWLSPGKVAGGAVIGTMVLVVFLLIISVLGKGKANTRLSSTPGEWRQPGPADPEPELLRFDGIGFDYRPPSIYWRQLDARRYGKGAVLVLEDPHGVFFTIRAAKITGEQTNALERVIAASKAAMRENNTSYTISADSAATYDDIDGWRTDAELSFQGHEIFAADWLVSSNGYNYRLTASGKLINKEEVEAEATQLFRGFQLTNAAEVR